MIWKDADALTSVTTLFLDLSFAAERWLRHTGRLARNTGKVEKVLSSLSIIFAVAGTCGLILLSIFDTLRYPRMHNGFLLLFMSVWRDEVKGTALRNLQCRLYHLSHFHMCRVSTFRGAFPTASYSPTVVLAEAYVYSGGNCHVGSIHCLRLPREHECWGSIGYKHPKFLSIPTWR